MLVVLINKLVDIKKHMKDFLLLSTPTRHLFPFYRTNLNSFKYKIKITPQAFLHNRESYERLSSILLS